MQQTIRKQKTLTCEFFVNEFTLINQYFDWGQGVGDDCALVSIDGDKQLATTIDTLIEEVHFPKNTTAQDIAYKALAVNLSDLAAMGATPLYFTLALTLPSIDEHWLENFSHSLKTLAKANNIALIGGDTTKGKLSITINAVGVVKKNQALARSGAEIGDSIFVSNTLGDAALAWQQIQNQQTLSDMLLKQFNRPQPQIKLAQRLLGVANSCIDVSDGLEQDLSHILTQSNVGASIDLKSLPLSKEVAQYIANTQDWCIVLAGGDDYELCFTVPELQIDGIKSIEKDLDIKLTKIGIITQKMVLEIQGLQKDCQSYRHF